ncbi:WD repeat and SOCS box-containing protein 2, partial [Chaetura pelagica]
CKASERKSWGGKAEGRGRGAAKEKTLECGQIVWGLAFSAWPGGGHGEPGCAGGLPCLILATGLNDGHIKVWEVQTGHLLFSLVGHQDVVRDLSFAPNGSLILVSASRDRTLRVWDLSRDGRQVQVLSGHVQWVYCCSISPDCSMLCSAAGEKSVSPAGWDPSFFTPPLSLPCCPGRWWSHHPWRDDKTLWVRHFRTRSRGWWVVLSVVWWWVLSGELDTRRAQLPSPGAAWTLATRSPPFLLRLLRIWALELRSPVAFAPMTNGLCCIYFPHGGFIATGTRDGHVQFWSAPRVLSSLKHLCRKALRTFLTTYQVLALPIPRKLKEFLTYRTF